MAELKGWFITPERTGDRTFGQQMIGLDRLLGEVRGKTVLDIGCAEGLISHQIARSGAVSVHGVEIIKSHLKIARRMAGDLPCIFENADANHWEPTQSYDIVLMLALLHKLLDPSARCRVLARAARDLCVIRLPPGGSVIVHERQSHVPHDIGAVMVDLGFHLEYETLGPFAEYLAYFRRNQYPTGD